MNVVPRESVPRESATREPVTPAFPALPACHWMANGLYLGESIGVMPEATVKSLRHIQTVVGIPIYETTILAEGVTLEMWQGDERIAVFVSARKPLMSDPAVSDPALRAPAYPALERNRPAHRMN